MTVSPERKLAAGTMLLKYAYPIMERLMEEGMTTDEAVAQVLRGRWAVENNVPFSGEPIGKSG